MSREALPDIVKRAIITERSPQLVNAQTLSQCATVLAAKEAFLAVCWTWGQEHSGAPMDIDAMTRKGKRERWKECTIPTDGKADTADSA